MGKAKWEISHTKNHMPEDVRHMTKNKGMFGE
jgi:hypothetical protein